MTSSILRNLIMRYGVKLNLTLIERIVLWHIIDHDHNEKGFSFPSEATLAKIIGVSDRYIREIIGVLESKKKFITIKRKLGFSNQYRYSLAKKSFTKFWKREKIKKTNPGTIVRGGRNYSSGESGTPVPPNTANNTANNTAYTYGNAKTHTPSKKNQARMAIKNQLELNFDKPNQVVEHLREITTNGHEGKAAADLTLRILEQLWLWGFHDELLKSWKWFFYAAATWPATVSQAWGEIKDRKLRGENMKKPGAILTLRIKELTNESNSLS